MLLPVCLTTALWFTTVPALPEAADSLTLRIVELRCAGKYADALEAALALGDVVQRDPTSRQWQRDDAERLAATLRLAAGLPVDQRRELAEADCLSATIDQHLDEASLPPGPRMRFAKCIWQTRSHG